MIAGLLACAALVSLAASVACYAFAASLWLALVKYPVSGLLVIAGIVAATELCGFVRRLERRIAARSNLPNTPPWPDGAAYPATIRSGLATEAEQSHGRPPVTPIARRGKPCNDANGKLASVQPHAASTRMTSVPATPTGRGKHVMTAMPSSSAPSGVIGQVKQFPGLQEMARPERSGLGTLEASFDPADIVPILDSRDLLGFICRARSVAYALDLSYTEVSLRRTLIALSREANNPNSLSVDELSFVEAMPLERPVPGVGICSTDWSRVEKAGRIRGGHNGS